MEVGFAEALLLIGGLLVAAASLSGWLHGTVLSISVLALGGGIALALLGVITIDPGDKALITLIELALILTLFADGLIVEHELVRAHSGPPARAIAVALPITLALIALAAKLFFPDLSWAEAFLLGAVLAPTDPVITSTIVTAQRVPARIRHALNLESGLNDGIALPFVLFFLILASPGGDASSEGIDLLGEAAAGAVMGIAIGLGGGRVLPHLPGGGIATRYEGLYALGLGMVSFGLAELTIANGFIAAFLSGAALGASRHEMEEAFVGFSEHLSAIFQVLTFVAFGALIVVTGYHASIWALLAFILFTLLLARPVAILAALARSKMAIEHRLFIAWFGPKGVASMLFALFVLNSQSPERSLVFDIAAFVILASILAHGLTDTLGARWIERHLPEESE